MFNIEISKNFLLSEIKINIPSQQLMYGYDNKNNFMDIVKIRGIKDPQLVLDKINKDFGYDEYGYYLSPGMDVPNDFEYVYLSGDSESYFTKDFSNFADPKGIESYGITNWVSKPIK